MVNSHSFVRSQNLTKCIGRRSGIVLNVADTVTSIALVLEFQLIHEAITIVGHGSNDMAPDDLEKIVVVCCFDSRSSLCICLRYILSYIYILYIFHSWFRSALSFPIIYYG